MKAVPTTEPAKKIAALYNRRETTPWDEKLIKRYKELVKAKYFDTLDDLDLVIRYTISERKKGDKGWHKRDLATFLNYYPQLIDRAKEWQSSFRSRTPAKEKRKENGEKPLSAEEFKEVGAIGIAEIRRLRENMRNPSFSEIRDAMKGE